MSILSLALMKDATSNTITGGTSATFETDGVEIKNGVHMVDTTESDFTVRPNITIKNRAHTLLPTGIYTKGKRDVTLVIPKLLADSSLVFNLVRINLEVHPETTAAELLNLRLLGCQCFSDSDMDNFYSYGSLK